MKGSDEERTERFQTATPLYPLSVSIQVSGLMSAPLHITNTVCVERATADVVIGEFRR